MTPVHAHPLLQPLTTHVEAHLHGLEERGRSFLQLRADGLVGAAEGCLVEHGDCILIQDESKIWEEGNEMGRV